jgi:adenine-specific DNA-methyltransferase
MSDPNIPYPLSLMGEGGEHREPGEGPTHGALSRRPWLDEHPEAIDRARSLRTRMTDAEQRLWFLLRSRRFRDYKFRRQYSIGPYVADFACVSVRLIVEADGGHHCENAYDDTRSAYIEGQGWRIVRFWNNDILQQTEAVLERIESSLAMTLTCPALPVGLSHEGEAKLVTSPIGERASSAQ